MSKRPSPGATASPRRSACAIYTRKSTTMGLEQEFNSLDAQRESCLAYIQRQPAGSSSTSATTTAASRARTSTAPRSRACWPTSRRTRSTSSSSTRSTALALAARLREGDGAAQRRRALSFVSVTQNFSTADAMGRLTMNMLMSFAEFEREMISERTRDKIAGSRRKGKWTGGPVPFGYSVKDKKLSSTRSRRRSSARPSRCSSSTGRWRWSRAR
jgi:site-specific DNA recombinase